MNRAPKTDDELLGLFQAEIQTELYEKIGEIPSYRAKQIYHWLNAKRAQQFSEMSQLPAQLRIQLEEHFTIGSLKLVTKSVSEDGTIKFLFELADGYQIES